MTTTSFSWSCNPPYRSGAERVGDVPKFDALVMHVHVHAHVHAHGNASSSELFCRVKAHSNSPLLVHIHVGRTRITKKKMLLEHTDIERSLEHTDIGRFIGSLGSWGTLAFLRIDKRGAAEFDLQEQAAPSRKRCSLQRSCSCHRTEKK